MKKLFTLCLFCLTSTLSVAQWQGTNPVYFNTGNVGIGTSTPAAKLEVYSTITGNSTLMYGGILGSKHNGYEFNIVGGIPIDGFPTSQGGHIRLGGPARGDAGINGIMFYQNGVERMRINNGGFMALVRAVHRHYYTFGVRQM